MGHSITSIDRTTLPEALLPLAKAHMRVTFTDDDEVITKYLQFAISYFEQFSGWRVFGADVAWSPVNSTTASRYQCPVQPVSDFTVMSAAVDVSSQYALEMGDPAAPVFLVHSDGTPFPSDAAVALVAGYEDPDDIEPNALGNILRIASTLYEHRESTTTLSVDQMPSWANDMISGLWIPRA
jgi:hypothetical protein